MTRNMRDTQKILFDRMRGRIRDTDVAEYAVDLDAPRWIGGQPEDSDALQRAKIVRSRFLPGKSFLTLVRWGDRAFVGTASPQDTARDPTTYLSWLSGPAQNTGLHVLILAENDGLLIAPPEQIVEAAFGSAGEMSLDDLKALFAPLALHEFQAAHAQKRDAELWSLCEACMAHRIARNAAPDWHDAVAVEFDALLEGDAARYAGDALLAAIYAHEPHHAFLQLYRAFEGLFRVVVIEAFLEKIGHPDATSRDLIASAMVAELGWRMREDQAVFRLISMLPEPVVINLAGLLACDPTSDSVSKKFYRTRNAIAHGSIFYTPPVVTTDVIRACMEIVGRSFAMQSVADTWIP